MASYSLTTLWYERARYLPGVLAVAFSSLLIALQCGLLLGLFAITSIPIDHTHADIWMAAPKVLSVDLGEPISEGLFARLQNQPEVERTEFFLDGFSYWSKPGGGRELCMIIGSNLREDSLGRVDELDPDLRSKLSEPGSVVVDESDLDRLGVAHLAKNGIGAIGRDRGAEGTRACPDRRPDARAEEPGRAVRLLLPRHGPGASVRAGRPDDLHPGPVPQPRRRARPWCNGCERNIRINRLLRAMNSRFARGCTG